MNVKIKCSDPKYMPVRSRVGDACYTCSACLPEATLVLNPGECRKVPLGFCTEFTSDYAAYSLPRSGLSLNNIDVKIGIIDSNYRGQWHAIVLNNSDKPFSIPDGFKICQMMFVHVPEICFMQVDKLSDSNRGTNGFGSSGV